LEKERERESVCGPPSQRQRDPSATQGRLGSNVALFVLPSLHHAFPDCGGRRPVQGCDEVTRYAREGPLSLSATAGRPRPQHTVSDWLSLHVYRCYETYTSALTSRYKQPSDPRAEKVAAFAATVRSSHKQHATTVSFPRPLDSRREEVNKDIHQFNRLTKAELVALTEFQRQVAFGRSSLASIWSPVSTCVTLNGETHRVPCTHSATRLVQPHLK
jgi:hypothetical protein